MGPQNVHILPSYMSCFAATRKLHRALFIRAKQPMSKMLKIA